MNQVIYFNLISIQHFEYNLTFNVKHPYVYNILSLNITFFLILSLIFAFSLLFFLQFFYLALIVFADVAVFKFSVF